MLIDLLTGLAVSGSVAAAACLLVRKAARGRLSARWEYRMVKLSLVFALAPLGQLCSRAEALLGSMAAAVAEGKSPQDALLVDGQSFADKAQDACDVIGEATDEDVAYVVDYGMELNIRSLKEAMAHRSGEETADSASGDAQEETAESSADGSTAYTQRELDLLTARRQLEETRLAMTAQANYALLKKGIQIDTQPLAELVEALKETENQYYEQLLKGQGVEASETNVNLFRETTERVNDLKTVPAYVLGAQGVKDASVAEVHDTGRAMRDTFERANQSYETLMTAPRADLGDSIQKAFRNVDDILNDIGLEATEANQRASSVITRLKLHRNPWRR